MSVSLEVPRGLSELLQNFTVALLREYPNYPENLVQFAADYFNALNERTKSGALGNGNTSLTKKSLRFGDADEIHEHPHSEHEDDDSDLETPPVNFMNRRQSVAAESFNPEEDGSDDEDALHQEDTKTPEQRSRLERAMKVILFRCLDDTQKETVIKAMKEVQVVEGQKVITQGEEGDNFYVIEKGKYDIYVRSQFSSEDVKVGNYEDEGSFGELALMYNTPRAATIVATTPGVIWSLDRATFRRIVLKRAFLKRQMYDTLLQSVSLLQELSDYERCNLADALVSREYKDGEQIIAQGDEGHEMYFIEEGQVRIVRRSSGPTAEEKQVNLLSKGNFFGELALITHKPRMASAFAVGPTKLCVLDIKSFERLMGPCVDIMQRNIDTYNEQLKTAFGSEEEIGDLRTGPVTAH